MPEYRTLLFATDFSPGADHALAYAAKFAQRVGAEMHILHAVVLPDHDLEAGVAPKEAESLFERLDEATRERLRDAVDRADAEASAFRLVRRRGHRPAPVILDYAEEVAADVIVQGTHGRRGPGRWLLGSTAEEVLRHATCDVLTVRQSEDEGQPPWRLTEGRVLVPVDFTAASVAAVRRGRSLAEALDARVELLHVVDLPTVPAEYGEPPTADAARIETRVRAELHRLGLSAGLDAGAFDVAADVGSAAAGIVDHAAARSCDLIVMPARSGRPRGLLGGTAHRVVRRATCPVLTLPPA